ncbi:hypothetical protein [Methanothermobacter tenebrarum]|uniref:Uncharacterized protein n=1 Tax=Methanothermobacter tenebrarum TaxID=680118 RepID=A0A328PF83_9EURY|nr:hypothetical protein [Methanothermobacter tenebrarum]NPV65079.1 hypothetical protein [Methanobacteriaceae archaeon]RAO78455.1 hypothetical protein DPC56_07950 [Methanothermobacter tenebrarum]
MRIKKLEKKEQLYKTILEKIGSAMIITDKNTTTLPKRSEKLTSHSKEKIEGKKSLLEFIKDDVEIMKKNIII